MKAIATRLGLMALHVLIHHLNCQCCCNILKQPGQHVPAAAATKFWELLLWVESLINKELKQMMRQVCSHRPQLQHNEAQEAIMWAQCLQYDKGLPCVLS